MAPALVKHSSAKERSSIGKKFLKLNCITSVDIVCVDKLSKHSVFAKDIFQSKNTAVICNNSIDFSSKAMPFIGDGAVNVKSKQDELHTNNVSNILQKKIDIATKNETTKHQIEEKRLCSETCSKTFSSNAGKFVEDKQKKIGTKLFDIEKNMRSLNNRLREFQLKHISSHIAIGSVRKTNTENDFIDVVSTEKTNKSDEITTRNKVNGTVKLFTHKKSKHPILHKTYDTINPALQQDTEDEDEYDCKARVPLARGKKKSENSPPSSADLYKWKEKRTQVGSKCSWLTIQIADLDKKLSTITKLHNDLRINRLASRKTIYSTNLTKPKIKDISTSSSDSLFLSPEEYIGGCSRVHPIAPSSKLHKYISIKDHKPSCTSNCSKPSGSGGGCTQQNFNTIQQKHLFPEKLDQCYHPSLSFRSDTSLSLLLEETLRNERINTKVTITKSTKKKKKQKPSVSEKSKDGEQTGYTKPRKNSKTNDEYSRKRQHTETTSGRLRNKMRKYSDTFHYDSSKPSTPTNELSSPLLAHSLPAQSFFPAIKQKKKTSSGDYDINNIVIPYSMAAATRVERIQYKEIPTPGWRNIWSELNLENGIDDWECTDDELYLERHDRCEIEEQKRFTDYFIPANNRRQRQNRSSECGISEPPSPAMLDELRSNVTTPVDSPSGMSNMLKLANRLANITPCLDTEKDPTWTYRRFPLSENENKKLDPIPSPIILPSIENPTLKQVSSGYSFRHSPYTLLSSSIPKNSPRESPVVNNTAPEITHLSKVPEIDTCVDRNWTVKLVNEPSIDVEVMDSDSKLQRKGIVLKLAKK